MYTSTLLAFTLAATLAAATPIPRDMNYVSPQKQNMQATTNPTGVVNKHPNPYAPDYLPANTESQKWTGPVQDLRRARYTYASPRRGGKKIRRDLKSEGPRNEAPNTHLNADSYALSGSKKKEGGKMARRDLESVLEELN